ncbi:cyclase family protein [Streptomyces plumbiresistens]|uniref:Cyclase family protein n=1 Tax=Streptomyces plumbiresistens TaxID=511811 RepID=A0ABP7SJM0_9ACTN
MCGFTTVTEEEKSLIAARSAIAREATKSPFGSDDQIGMLNVINADSMRMALANVDPRKVYDMSTDFFPGMPSYDTNGDMSFQYWLTHTPRDEMFDGSDIGYSGDSVAFYTHTGTHVDTLNHFSYNSKVWNNFSVEKNLRRDWNVGGADKHPPTIARGILLDIPATQGADVLPDSYGIGRQEIEDALKRQNIEVRFGDVVLVRTGRMRLWPDRKYLDMPEPGLTLEGAKALAENGAVTIGADNLGLEVRIPHPTLPGFMNLPVHYYLLIEAGIPMIECMDLEELAADGVYEFAYVGACMKIRGATGAPVRPLAIPLAG